MNVNETKKLIKLFSQCEHIYFILHFQLRGTQEVVSFSGMNALIIFITFVKINEFHK